MLLLWASPVEQKYREAGIIEHSRFVRMGISVLTVRGRGVFWWPPWQRSPRCGHQWPWQRSHRATFQYSVSSKVAKQADSAKAVRAITVRRQPTRIRYRP